MDLLDRPFDRVYPELVLSRVEGKVEGLRTGNCRKGVVDKA
jgi:hypothetical protein